AHRPFRGLLGVHSRYGLHTRAATNSWHAFRRLQLFRHLHSCSGCFRLERLPGGACTHWKAPPSHGAHPRPTFDRHPPISGRPLELPICSHARPGRRSNLCPSSSFGEAVSFHHLVQVLISVDFPEQPTKKPVTDIRFFRVVGLAFGTLHHLVSSGTSVAAMFLAYFVPRSLKVLLLPH